MYLKQNFITKYKYKKIYILVFLEMIFSYLIIGVTDNIGWYLASPLVIGFNCYVVLSVKEDGICIDVICSKLDYLNLLSTSFPIYSNLFVK